MKQMVYCFNTHLLMKIDVIDLGDSLQRLSESKALQYGSVAVRYMLPEPGAGSRGPLPTSQCNHRN